MLIKLDYNNVFDMYSVTLLYMISPDVQLIISKGYNSLKKKGIMIVLEPKSENPVAIIGRKFFNPKTPTEHPFSKDELGLIFKNEFGNVNLKYFYLLSSICFIFEKIILLKSSFVQKNYF